MLFLKFSLVFFLASFEDHLMTFCCTNKHTCPCKGPTVTCEKAKTHTFIVTVCSVISNLAYFRSLQETVLWFKDVPTEWPHSIPYSLFLYFFLFIMRSLRVFLFCFDWYTTLHCFQFRVYLSNYSVIYNKLRLDVPAPTLYVNIRPFVRLNWTSSLWEIWFGT